MTQLFSLLTSLQEAAGSIQKDLKHADLTDAGKYDVIDKAHASGDVNFTNMRNTINASGEITGSDVADYIEQAEMLNDEIDTVVYGLETTDGNIVKVYVNAEQTENFEEELSKLLGVEDDIEEAINRLASRFDIVDVVWPVGDKETPTGVLPGDNENVTTDQLNGLEPVSLLGPEDDDDDDFEIVASLPSTDRIDGAEDGSSPTDGVEDVASLPDVVDTDEADILSRLNDLAVEMFGTEPDSEVLGIRDLQPDELAKLIKLEDADKIAITQYKGADFISLDDDEQREILEANPDLVIDHDEDEGNEEAAIDAEAKLDAAGGEDVEIQTTASTVSESSRGKFSLLQSL